MCRCELAAFSWRFDIENRKPFRSAQHSHFWHLFAQHNMKTGDDGQGNDQRQGKDNPIQKVKAVSSRVFASDYLCRGPKSAGVSTFSIGPPWSRTNGSKMPVPDDWLLAELPMYSTSDRLTS